MEMGQGEQATSCRWPSCPHTDKAKADGILSLFICKYPVSRLYNRLPGFACKRRIKAASPFVKKLQCGLLLLGWERHAEVGSEATELDTWSGYLQVAEINKLAGGL